MNELFEKAEAQERNKEALKYSAKNNFKAKEKFHYKFSTERVNNLLEFLHPQYLDKVVAATKSALYKIDPTWQTGQFKAFSKHFRMNLLRSLYTRRFPLENAKFSALDKDKILEMMLETSQGFSDHEKAAFYGKVLSEYILRCPKERFPIWAESYKDKPNFIIMWNLNSSIWLTIYY